ncbi:hypothetical protein HDU90_007335 [Geranomyces variabilis]|nr:hypothetical protein HDU90_007335 [Geranomyces variabilis]
MADLLQQSHARWEFSLNSVNLQGNIDPLRRVEEWALEVSKHAQVSKCAGFSVCSAASYTQDGRLPANQVTTPEQSTISDGDESTTHPANLPEQPLIEELEPADRESERPAAVWGQLVPLDAHNGVPPIDLITKCGDGTENQSASYLVGRHRMCDVVLPFLKVSNRHCLLHKEIRLIEATGCPETAVYIEDFSRNGTWLNDTLMERRQRYALKCGDAISFAHNRTDTVIFTLPGVERPQPSFFDKYDLTELLKKWDRGCLATSLTPKMGLVTQIQYSGDFAAVWLAENRTSAETVVVKVIPRDSIDGSQDATFGRNIVAETRFWEKLEHPHITSILEVLWDPENMYIVMKRASGGNLFEAIIEQKKFAEPIARDIMKQILEALQYLHAQNVTHRNLKLEKIFACETDNQFFDVQISDFVKPRILSGPLFTESVCGTPDYVAPEILKSQTTQGLGPVCNKAADMWSCGVILYICLCGYPPFSEELGPPTLKEQIMEGKVKFRLPWWSSMSQASLDLIMGLLTLDPSKRMTAEQALKHPWITLKHPTRDKSCAVQTSHIEYPPDYCWPKQVVASVANRVVPALERPRPSHKRGIPTGAEHLNIKKKIPVAPMTKASAAAHWTVIAVPEPSPIASRTRTTATAKAVPRSIREADITSPAPRKGKTPTERLAAAQGGEQQALPKTQSTIIVIPPLTSVTDDDQDDNLPVQSQGSHCEPAAPAVSQPRPVPRMGKRRVVAGAKCGLIKPARPSAFSHAEQKPTASRGIKITDIGAIDENDLAAIPLERPRTVEFEDTPAPIMPPLRRSGRLRSEKKA